jgi:putative proteasome-type protease
VLDLIDRDLKEPGEHESLATVSHLFEAALYIGRLSRSVVEQHRAGLGAIGADATASFILGGQIAGERPEITLVYPEGNYVRPSDDRPFLQIGESKYGKFLLDVAILAHADLVTSLKIALGSMMSTARANLSVGPPFDAAVYRNDAFDLDEHRFTAESPILGELREVWERNILNAVGQLPDVELSELRAAAESRGA